MYQHDQNWSFHPWVDFPRNENGRIFKHYFLCFYLHNKELKTTIIIFLHKSKFLFFSKSPIIFISHFYRMGVNPIWDSKTPVGEW
jgi:hypothetical protein